MKRQDFDHLRNAALLGGLRREQGPTQSEPSSSPMAGASPRTTAGVGHWLAARLPQYRGTSVRDKCFCTSCHYGQGEAPRGGPRTPQGCGAVAEHRVRGVSTDVGCCPARMAGERNVHLCWTRSSSKLRSSTQVTASQPTGPGCWAETPGYLVTLFSFF